MTPTDAGSRTNSVSTYRTPADATDRAVSPVVGVVLLIAITVIGATTVGLAVSVSPPEPAPTAAFDATVDADAERIAITHQAGDPLDLTETELRIEVDGEPLAHQPPVPFFAATGFRSGPTGPFNTASSDRWRAGNTGSLALAGTNEPRIEPGSTVGIEVIVAGEVIAKVEVSA